HLDVADATPPPKPLLGLDSAYWFKIIEAGILSLTALLMGFFVVRPLIQRMFAPQPAGESTALLSVQQIAGQLPAPAAAAAQAGGPVALPAPRESMIDISRIEGQVRESSIKKVGEVVGSHPEEALAIIRTWLHEPV
ncbi:MAG TPA: hypothetical protein VIJ85_02335, partial [Rhizomicrobium sp.]